MRESFGGIPEGYEITQDMHKMQLLMVTTGTMTCIVVGHDEGQYYNCIGILDSTCKSKLPVDKVLSMDLSNYYIATTLDKCNYLDALDKLNLMPAISDGAVEIIPTQYYYLSERGSEILNSNIKMQSDKDKYVTDYKMRSMMNNVFLTDIEARAQQRVIMNRSATYSSTVITFNSPTKLPDVTDRGLYGKIEVILLKEDGTLVPGYYLSFNRYFTDSQGNLIKILGWSCYDGITISIKN